MPPHEGGQRRSYSSPTAQVLPPSPTVRKSTGFPHSGIHNGQKHLLNPVVASRFAERAPRLTLSDIVGWALFIFIIAVILLGLCVMTTLAWPGRP